MEQTLLKTTPFYTKQAQLGGKFVHFHGWELPVQFTSITQEHTSVRNGVGLFDISHMGQVFVWGPQAEAYLQNLVTNDVRKASLGKGIYAHILNEKGTVIDDIYVFQIEETKYLLIVNASRKMMDLDWMQKQKMSFEVEILEAPQAAGLALQGPRAAIIMEKLSARATDLKKNEIGEFDIGDISALISRTGYTGEDGFEFFAPAGHLLIVWDHLFQVGKDLDLVPCGLGARDTLRTEVAYPLYGHELDENHTPLEAGLEWVVKWDKGEFIGKNALQKQKSEGLKTKLYGFKVETGGVARPGGTIRINNNDAGIVASGTFSPTLNYPIGMAYLPVQTPEEKAPLTILQGTRELKAITTKLPFYKKI